MIEEMKEDIERVFRRNQCHYPERFENLMIIYFIYIKYLCEMNELQYEEVIHSKEILVLKNHLRNLERLFKDDSSMFNSLLRNYSHTSSKELALELIQSFSIPIQFQEEQEEVLFLDNGKRAGYFDRDESLQYFDLNGKTTYIIEKEIGITGNVEVYQILNEVLNLTNQFIEDDLIDFSRYHYLYVLGNSTRYQFIRNTGNEYEKIKEYISKVDHIILYTKYSMISNFKEGRRIGKYLKNIIIQKENTLLWFCDLSEEEKPKTLRDTVHRDISIINYDTATTSLEQLKSILQKNRKQKNILVKTTYQEILENNMRIGFNLYQLGKDDVGHDINRIVDENTKLLEQLNDINKTVELEINKLLNR